MKLVLSLRLNMSNVAGPNDSKPVEIVSIDEKIARYEPWDDREWQKDWMKVYNRVVSFTAGGAVFGAGHALSTGRSILPNAMAFAGYSTIVAGVYFASREAIFGREIERFRREALALGLPESQARDYPWRWDFFCGGIAGGVFGAMIGQSRRTILLAAGLFGSAAVAMNAGSQAIADFALPRLLSGETIEFERADRRKLLAPEDLERLDAAEEEQRRKHKPALIAQLPDWSPVRAYTADERREQLQNDEYDKWLAHEVEETRVSVAIKRQLRHLELERLRSENPDLAETLRVVPTRPPRPNSPATNNDSKPL